jgi:hypothetical protein
MSEPTSFGGSATGDHVPAPSGSEADTSADAGPAPAAPPSAGVPGYEVLGVLGCGAMGVVYKARDLRLNRVVALKMVRAGELATSDELLRFLAEAATIAHLQHPNIVQVFESGQHDGLPYFSLEYIEGGSLASWLKGTTLSAREAARVVEALARGVHFAHQHGIVHRDLKPGNVLLAGGIPSDVAGTRHDDRTVPGRVPSEVVPKVTDFGLAKRVAGGAELTETGAVMGTPSYMAPEQARGDNKGVGPAADVYALGAILYDCLTGRPPFKGPTPLDTLFQVLEDEPVPPTQLQTKTPRDLETVCLKCLRKEPARRYANAADLAEDLRRFQAGEPILARPVGSVEKAVKWARRRPAAAALLVSLVLGTAVSTYFGVQASRRAHDAEINANTARDNETKANEAREQAEATLARSLLRQVGRGGRYADRIEMEAIWELAQSQNDRVRLLFLEFALQSSNTSHELRNRRQQAVHAAVGLDRTRQQRLEEMLLARLRDNAVEPRVREDSALIAAALERPRPELVKETARALAQTIAEDTDPLTLYSSTQGLVLVSARLEPEAATEVARALTAAMAKEQHPYSLTLLTEALHAVLARLGQAEAARRAAEAARTLAERTAITTVANPEDLAELAKAQSTVSAQLEPAEAARRGLEAARAFAETLSGDYPGDAPASLAKTLGEMSARLEPEAVVELARELAGAMAREKKPDVLAKLAMAQDEVLARLKLPEAAQWSAEAVRVLTEAMAKEQQAYALYALAGALEKGLARLEPAEAARRAAEATRVLAEALAMERDASLQALLVEALVPMSARLGPAEASSQIAEAARVLAEAMGKNPSPQYLPVIAKALDKGLSRLEPAEAARRAAEAAQVLSEALAKQQRPYELTTLAEALSTVSARLEPAEAARRTAEAYRSVSKSMVKTNNSNDLFFFTRTLGVISSRLEKDEAARVLAEALSLTPDDSDVFAEALAKLSTRLEQGEAARRAVLTAQVVADWMSASKRLSCAFTLTQATRPLPNWFSTQQLVDLLKMPTCVGPTRKVILDQLAKRYKRPFADVWEFVEWAQKNEPGLDFTSPPKRNPFR